jgi:hypothetical protein
MKFLNPVFLPTLFIVTVAATPPSWAQSKSQTVESKTAAASSSNEQKNILAALCHPG